jgi:hypothetical protein
MRLLSQVIDDVKFELGIISAGFPPYNSPHEGYAVLLEELKELEAEVFKQPAKRSRQDMYVEACQVAAVAIRFMTDCCGETLTQPAGLRQPR